VKTAILGGGLSGLTLARLLAERNEDITVLEAGERTGGLCQSVRKDGFIFDTGGSHIIFSRDQEVLSFMHKVLACNRNECERNTKIFYKGLFIKYPFENGLSALPKDDLFFCINEFIKALIRSEKGEFRPPLNFKEWIYQTFGKGIAECYMVPYNEKIWNFKTEMMSAHWMEGRVPRPPVEDVIRSAIGIETEGYTHQSVFSYPLDGGIESLVHAIGEPVKDQVITNFRVSSVRREDGKWIISNGTQTIVADRCISTIPLQYLIPTLSDVPGDVIKAVDDLKYNSLISVSIGIKGNVPPISWMYIPDEKTGMENRISFPSNFSPGTAPVGCSSILAEITYNDGDAISAMTDQEIIDHVKGSLSIMGLISPESVISTGIYRHHFAYVVYDLQYLKNIAIIREYCDKIGISLVGRFSRFEYLNMDGCIRNAIDFVRGS
jgi:protoporphyrinogen oxidase